MLRFRLDPQSLAWKTIESGEVPRSMFGAVVANNKVYVMGRKTDGCDDVDRSVEVYDIACNTWSKVCFVAIECLFILTGKLLLSLESNQKTCCFHSVIS